MNDARLTPWQHNAKIKNGDYGTAMTMKRNLILTALFLDCSWFIPPVDRRRHGDHGDDWIKQEERTRAKQTASMLSWTTLSAHVFKFAEQSLLRYLVLLCNHRRRGWDWDMSMGIGMGMVRCFVFWFCHANANAKESVRLARLFFVRPFPPCFKKKNSPFRSLLFFLSSLRFAHSTPRPHQQHNPHQLFFSSSHTFYIF